VKSEISPVKTEISPVKSDVKRKILKLAGFEPSEVRS